MNLPWPEVPLGSAMTYRKNFIDISGQEVYKRCRVQLHTKGIVLRDIITGADIKTKQQQVCRAGEFLVAEIDAKVGGFGIVPEGLDGAIVSSHYFLFTLNPTVLDQKFLSYFICTPAFRDQISAQGSTNYAAIRPKDVLQYRIPLPRLSEQRRIVAWIEQLAAKIEEARNLRRQAGEEAASLVSSLHLALAGTRTVRLAEILVLDEIREEVRFGQQYPQVGVKGFGQGLFPKEKLDATQTTYKAFNRLYDGALVLSQVKGWEGAVAVCRSDLAGRYVSPEYRTFRCIPERAIPEYLAALCTTSWFWTQLKTLTRGVGARRERTRPEQFLQLELPMPSINQQERAIPIFEKLETLKCLQAETEAELDALLPSILDKAFKGKL